MKIYGKDISDVIVYTLAAIAFAGIVFCAIIYIADLLNINPFRP